MRTLWKKTTTWHSQKRSTSPKLASRDRHKIPDPEAYCDQGASPQEDVHKYASDSHKNPEALACRDLTQKYVGRENNHDEEECTYDAEYANFYPQIQMDEKWVPPLYHHRHENSWT